MKIQFLWTFALLASCTHPAERSLPVNGSMLPSGVIQNHESLNGQDVRLSGYLVVEFEDRGIWDSKKSRDKSDGLSRCVSLLIPRNVLADMERLSKTHVVIEGRIVSDFRSRGTAILGACNFVAIEVHSFAPLDAGR
jgi:hypothetical protein